jgi:ATPase subunit of ABC transporter with duplicated ATPase domains
MAALLTIEGVEKSFHGKKLLAGVSLVVDEAERNRARRRRTGSGKSTLLSIMAGREQPEAGRRTLAPRSASGLFEQEPTLPKGLTRARRSTPAGETRSESCSSSRKSRRARHRPQQRLDALLARQARLESGSSASADTTSSTGSSTCSTTSARRSRRRATRCRAANAGAWRWRGSSSAPPISCCSTNPRTTSTRS